MADLHVGPLYDMMLSLQRLDAFVWIRNGKRLPDFHTDELAMQNL